MTTFILSKDTETERVILDECSHGLEIATIQADAVKNDNGDVLISAWCVAREKVDESKLVRVDGHGWFA